MLYHQYGQNIQRHFANFSKNNSNFSASRPIHCNEQLSYEDNDTCSPYIAFQRFALKPI